MSDQIMQLDASKPLLRVAMILALLLALIASCFVVRWYLGSTLSEYLNAEEYDPEMGMRAASWAPGDPFTHWRLGEIEQRKFSLEKLPQVVTEYERAASLSPNDYRFWMSLGIVLERAGEDDRAEKALRQAVELAPSYAYPHWHLGNLLARSGRYDEAFAELRRASAEDTDLYSQLFNLAWEVHNQDFDSLKRAVGPAPEVRAQLSLYLLGRQRFEDGLLLWQSLSEAEKRANRSAGEAMINVLINAHRYLQAAGVANDLVPDAAYRATEERFVDGGFEENLAPRAGVFGWQVTSVQQAQIGIDPAQGHTGRRSLRIVFNVRARLDSINASQIVLVKPDSEYDFECYLKTEKLESGATPFLQVINPTDGSVLVSSETAPNGSNNWRPIVISFKTQPNLEAVIVRLARSSCGQDPVCPIFGSVWYDDFNLKRRR